LAALRCQGLPPAAPHPSQSSTPTASGAVGLAAVPAGEPKETLEEACPSTPWLLIKKK